MLHTGFIGILNGVIGDYLQKSKNPLSIEMDFYHRKKPLLGDLSIVKKDYPLSNNRICIFIHGSSSSEQNWIKKDSINYIDTIYNTYHILPLTLRYNSGLHISENGQLLDTLLQQLITDNKVDELIIIGHSMGGLIFRSALHYAVQSQNNWIEKVNHAFYLGSPHHGAPLEKFGALTQSILKQINTPYTKAADKLVDIRSNGVKDLRHGYLTEEEWIADQNDIFPKNRKIPLKEVGNIHQYVIAATVAEQTDSLLANWFGDMMVRKNSALGKSKNENLNISFNPENTLLLGKTAHLSLMYNKRACDFIIDKLQAHF